MKRSMAGIGLLIVAVVIAMVWLSAANAPRVGMPSSNEPATIASSAQASTEVAAATATELDTQAAASIPRPSPPAWQTMAAAREHGDDRAPPIERPGAESQVAAATAWELSDPARYREYELRGQRQVRDEYLIAAEQELPKWKALLRQARANGAPPAAIAEAEEKIRRLEMRQMALRRDESKDARQE
ncbi:MAG: hypothetical protein ACREP7_22835 [Lysobacter sp.]